MYWSEGGEARVFAAVDNFVYALAPDSGKPIAGFGQGGRIDLREQPRARTRLPVRATHHPRASSGAIS